VEKRKRKINAKRPAMIRVFRCTNALVKMDGRRLIFLSSIGGGPEKKVGYGVW
jgi:hypothetical protein